VSALKTDRLRIKLLPAYNDDSSSSSSSKRAKIAGGGGEGGGGGGGGGGGSRELILQEITTEELKKQQELLNRLVTEREISENLAPRLAALTAEKTAKVAEIGQLEINIRAERLEIARAERNIAQEETKKAACIAKVRELDASIAAVNSDIALKRNGVRPIHQQQPGRVRFVRVSAGWSALFASQLAVYSRVDTATNLALRKQVIGSKTICNSGVVVDGSMGDRLRGIYLEGASWFQVDLAGDFDVARVVFVATSNGRGIEDFPIDFEYTLQLLAVDSSVISATSFRTATRSGPTNPTYTFNL